MTKNILIIDDNDHSAESLTKRILSTNPEYGVYSVTISPKKDTLALLADKSIDLVIVSTRMLSIDNYGPKIINEIKEQYPDLNVVATGTNRYYKQLWRNTEYRQKKFLLNENNPSLENILDKYLS